MVRPFQRKRLRPTPHETKAVFRRVMPETPESRIRFQLNQAEITPDLRPDGTWNKADEFCREKAAGLLLSYLSPFQMRGGNSQGDGSGGTSMTQYTCTRQAQARAPALWPGEDTVRLQEGAPGIRSFGSQDGITHLIWGIRLWQRANCQGPTLGVSNNQGHLTWG